MKKRYLLGIVMTLCFLPITAKADCSNERLAELSKIADNVKLSYTYEIGNSGAEFKVKINNISNDIYVSNSAYEKQYFGNGEVDDSYIYTSGTSLTYTIYSNDNSCKGEALTSKYLTLPYYNNFSSLQECADNPNFGYCKKWSDTSNLTMNEFEKALAEYKNTGKNVKTKEEAKTSWWDNYKYYVFAGTGVLVVAIVIIVIVFVRKRKKDIL